MCIFVQRLFLTFMRCDIKSWPCFSPTKVMLIAYEKIGQLWTFRYLNVVRNPLIIDKLASKSMRIVLLRIEVFPKMKRNYAFAKENEALCLNHGQFVVVIWVFVIFKPTFILKLIIGKWAPFDVFFLPKYALRPFKSEVACSYTSY